MSSRALSLVLAWSLPCAGLSSQHPTPHPKSERQLEPLQRWPLPAAVAAPRWLDDVVAARDALAELPADLDLTGQAILLVPAPLPPGQQLRWHRGDLRDGEWRVQLRAGAQADGEGPGHGAAFLLPRVAEPVRLHVPIAAGPPLPLLRLPDPASGERLRVLAVRSLALPAEDRRPDPAGGAPRCEQATSVAEWNRLREGLGEAAARLPADVPDFAQHRVVLVRLPPEHAFPGLRLRVATEEDVDVLTVVQRLPSGVYREAVAEAALLTLPRRAHALAVVLRQEAGPGPGQERTLATFPALQ